MPGSSGAGMLMVIITMAWYHVPYILHPLAGSDRQTFWRMYRDHGPYSPRSKLSRSLAIASVEARRFLDQREERQNGEAIRQHELSEPPLFIIGHWRSGTTLLHNLLSKDPRFAYLTFFQTVMPWAFMQPLRKVRRMIAGVMPRDRQMDQIELGINEPQEEEMALAAMNELSVFRCFYFPHMADYYFRKSVLMEGLTPSEEAAFADAYRYLLQKLSYANEGRPLLLKNPANTARMPFLQEAFPGSRFVHIVRNPLHVYASACNLWEYMFESFAWSDWSEFHKEEFIITYYRELMQAHLAQRASLSAGDLIEIHFEDLVKNPMKTLETLYQRLDLEFSPEAREKVRAHLDATSHHKAKRHEISPELEARLRSEWDFAFEHWGY